MYTRHHAYVLWFQSIFFWMQHQVVASAAASRGVVDVCCGNELLQTTLPHLLEQLELCQKSLSAYLEAKRSEFPRFYFVSDPVLLEILSLGSNPAAVVPHFQSGLFDSLANVIFDPVQDTRCCTHTFLVSVYLVVGVMCFVCVCHRGALGGVWCRLLLIYTRRHASQVEKCKMVEMVSQQGERVRLTTPVETKGTVYVSIDDACTLCMYMRHTYIHRQCGNVAVPPGRGHAVNRQSRNPGRCNQRAHTPPAGVFAQRASPSGAAWTAAALDGRRA